MEYLIGGVGWYARSEQLKKLYLIPDDDRLDQTFLLLMNRAPDPLSNLLSHHAKHVEKESKV